MRNGFILPSATDNIYFHRVQNGETLSNIIQNTFHVGWNDMQPYITQALGDNPDILSPDLIRSGQLIILREPVPGMCLAPVTAKEKDYIKNLWQNMDKQTQDAVIETSPWYTGLSLGLAGVVLLCLPLIIH